MSNLTGPNVPDFVGEMDAMRIRILELADEIEEDQRDDFEACLEQLAIGTEECYERIEDRFPSEESGLVDNALVEHTNFDEDFDDGFVDDDSEIEDEENKG